MLRTTVHDTLHTVYVAVAFARRSCPSEQRAAAHEADSNLWAWYHRENNDFFMQHRWCRRKTEEKLAFLDFVTFVFSVDVSSAFTESVFSITKGTKDPKRQRLETEQVANYVRLGSLQRVPVRRIPPKQLSLNTLEVATYRRNVPGDEVHAVADNTTSSDDDNDAGGDADDDTDDDGGDDHASGDDDDGADSDSELQ